MGMECRPRYGGKPTLDAQARLKNWVKTLLKVFYNFNFIIIEKTP
jgi:hypothetical protein